MKKLLFIPLMAAAVLGVSCKTNKTVETQKLDLTNLDESANLKENFYQWAGGGWIAKHPLTPEYSRYGSFDKLGEDNQQQLKTLVEELAGKAGKLKGEGKKVGMLFNIAMDSAKRNADGYEPIKEDLAEINAMQTKEDALAMLVKMERESANPFFGPFAYVDELNSSQNIFQLYQGGTGLSRDYYFDEFLKDKYDAYVEHIAKMFALCGYSEEEAAAKRDRVIAVERALAEVQFDKVTLRDVTKNYNKMSVEEAAEIMVGFPLPEYLKLVSPDYQIEELAVCQIPFFKGMAKIYAETDMESMKAYYEWNLIRAAAGCLSDAFAETSFDFWGRTMQGQQEMKPRWKRAIGAVNSLLGEAVGKMYVEKYFPASAKERIVKLVDNIKLAMGQRMANATWMSDETKARGQEKLDAIIVKVGYPDKWRDYSALEIKDDSYWANTKRASVFENEYMMSKLGKPVDRTEWLMEPQTVNAYYNPSTNEICFPAAILQPPFFYANGDDAINYGGIGVVIGHELSHGFDDQGRNYDKDGNLADWWTEDDAKNFTERAQILVDHFNAIEVQPGLMANGALTLGENIADNGGLNIAYTALQMAIAENPEEGRDIDGYTAAQRFFMSYALLWAQNIRPEAEQNLTKNDVHSLGKWRVNGTLPHVDEFLKAFDIQEGDAMWLAPEKRAHIW